MTWNSLKAVVLILLIIPIFVVGQDDNLTGIEVSTDQDVFADFLHDDPVEAYNYTAALRLGIYGEWANSVYLGLPWVRQKVDDWLIDPMIGNTLWREDYVRHNFVLTINGFSPAFINDETPLFQDTLAAGYSLANDLPFASFTGFRSTRRLQLYKNVAHSAGQIDLAVNTSFTFGFASLGVIQGVENLLGAKRPDAILWDEDEDKPYPTGQLNHTMVPIFMWSLSMERVFWRPLPKLVFQVRPELNLGYYTDIGIGLDFGKVMNTDRFVDNLSYTDTNNPGLLSINDKNIGFSLVGGIVARGVVYNAHYHGFFGWNKREEWAWNDTRRFMLEGYAGLKLQFFRKVELNFSINTRSPMLNVDESKFNTWGTAGLKILLGPPGEGCYD